MTDVCSICGGSFHFMFPHDHRLDNSGLDDQPPKDSSRSRSNKARELFDAVGELALAIKPHNNDRHQRERIRQALTVLVDHIIEIGETSSEPTPSTERPKP